MPKREQMHGAYKLAQCNASAREMLIRLGVKGSLIPDVDDQGVWRNHLDMEPSYDRIEAKLKQMGIRRFRRTSEELKQLEEFTLWQLDNRIKNRIENPE